MKYLEAMKQMEPEIEVTKEEKVELSRPAQAESSHVAADAALAKRLAVEAATETDEQVALKVHCRLNDEVPSWERWARGERKVEPLRQPLADCWEDLSEEDPTVQGFMQAIEAAEQRSLDLFQEWQSSKDSMPLPGEEVLAELENIAQSLDERMVQVRGKVRRQDMALLKNRYDAYMSMRSTWATLVHAGDTTLFEQWSSWQHALENSRDQNHQKAVKLFDAAIQVHRPFLKKPEFNQNSSHRQMNATRLVGGMHVYLKARKRALELLRANPGAKICIMDIGGCAFGMSTMSNLKKMGGVNELFLHSMNPIVEYKDRERLGAVDLQPGVVAIDASRRAPMAGMHVNYCPHECRSCTCMAHYDHIVAIAIHAGYYLQAQDFANLHRYTDELYSVEHVVDIGQHVPTQEPEYRWEDGRTSDAVGWVSRMRNKILAAVTGVTPAVLRPVRRNCTFYEIPDTSVRLKRGGFHVTDYTLAAIERTKSVRKLIRDTCIVTATAAATTFVTTPGPLEVRAVVGAVAGGMAAAGYVTALRVAHAAETLEYPPIGTNFTVRIHEATTFNLASDDEPLVSVLKYKMIEPAPLKKVNLEQITADQEDLGRTTASLLMAGTDEKAIRQTMVPMVRAKKPLIQVRDTIYHARRALNYLTAPLGAPPPPKPMPIVPRVAVCLPFAWGVAHLLASMRLVQSLPLVPALAATAPFAPTISMLSLTFSQVLTLPICLLAASLGALWLLAHYLLE